MSSKRTRAKQSVSLLASTLVQVALIVGGGAILAAAAALISISVRS